MSRVLPSDSTILQQTERQVLPPAEKVVGDLQNAPLHELENKSPVEALVQEFENESASLVGEYIRRDQHRKDLFGSAVGKLLVKQLFKLNIPRRKEGERSVAMTAIKKMEAFYRNVFPSESEYEKFRAGFMAEFAVAYTLVKQIGLGVYEATEKEDTEAKVDYWLKLDDVVYPDEKIEQDTVALQIKCWDSPEEYVWSVRKPEDLEKIIDKFSNNIPDVNRFRQNGLKMLNSTNPYENVQCAYIIMPSAEADNARHNSRNGIPSEGFAGDLQMEIHEKLIKNKKRRLD